MKILDCLYWEEATWARNRWQDYGVSAADCKKIDQEYDRFKTRKVVNIAKQSIFKPTTK